RGVERQSPHYNPSTLMKSPDIEIFPLATSDYLYIKVKKDSLSLLTFKMYNIIGIPMPVYSEKLEDGTYRINVKGLYQGQYVLVLNDPGRSSKRSYKFTRSVDKVKSDN
ncbi:hypothetical protein, partial [Xanthovirga aplysinae]|uniref:hypothetical protein n=1 Tax=Xanthovirga aplysinae TaxID=2529853 RepID=UPI00165741AC